MAWVTFVLVWFAATVLPAKRGSFAFGGGLAGVILYLALNAVNPAAVIVRLNACRARNGHSFDAAYATSLGADAVPELLDALSRIFQRKPVARSRTRWSTGGAQIAATGVPGIFQSLRRCTRCVRTSPSCVPIVRHGEPIRRRSAEEDSRAQALWREEADGLRLVWREPFLRAVVIQAPLVNFAFNGVLFTITLSLRQHGTSTAVIGLVQAGIAAAGCSAPWWRPGCKGACA